MEEEYRPELSDGGSRRSPEEAESELIRTAQKEIGSRLLALADFIGRAPQQLPDKELMQKMVHALSEMLNADGVYTVEHVRQVFFDDLNSALKPLGYHTAEQRQLAHSEHAEETLGQILRTGHLPEYLQSSDAAKQELERLRPWLGEHVIVEDREGARYVADDIYTRFPQLWQGEQ